VVALEVGLDPTGAAGAGLVAGALLAGALAGSGGGSDAQAEAANPKANANDAERESAITSRPLGEKVVDDTLERIETVLARDGGP
jgi:hypothetical protein